MKKILTLIIIPMLSFSAISDGVFNMQIPQPNFISNDWDGDGIPNNTDPDDDGDGLMDEDDSIPFGQTGQSSTPDLIFNSFSSDQDYLVVGNSAILSWDIEFPRDLKIYSDEGLTNLIADVTGETQLIVSPTSTQTYYLDYSTGVADVSINMGQNLGSVDKVLQVGVCNVVFTSSGRLVLSNISLHGAEDFRQPRSNGWGSSVMLYATSSITATPATSNDGSTYPMKAIEGGYLQNYGGYKYYQSSLTNAFFDIKFSSARNVTKVSYNNRSGSNLSGSNFKITGYSCAGDIVFQQNHPYGLYNENISNPTTIDTAFTFAIE